MACFYGKLPVQKLITGYYTLGHLCRFKERLPRTAVDYSTHSTLDTAACTARSVVQPCCVVLGVEDLALAYNEVFKYQEASPVLNMFLVISVVGFCVAPNLVFQTKTCSCSGSGAPAGDSLVFRAQFPHKLPLSR